MRKAILALFLATPLGCANGYKSSYVAGAVTKQFSTESYSVYSEQFNSKIDECCANEVCDPSSPSVITKTELDECMGNAFKSSTHDEIENAVKIYYAAAQAHTAVMQIADGSDDERRVATENLINAAINLLALLPEGKELVENLKQLTGR